MQLRFREDARTLFWAFVLFPGVALFCLSTPSVAPWLLPIELYLAYCAGVLVHNQNHNPVFAARWCNTAYAAWLGVFYGAPIFTWIPTHNQNHHRYVDSAEDVTHTWRGGRKNSLWNALTYPLRSTRYQLPLVLSFVRESRQRSPAMYRRILLESATIPLVHGLLLGGAIWLHGVPLGLLGYACGFGIPALLAPYFMMFTNYLQHVGCETGSPDNHSRNFVSPRINWLVFDAGLHTVHHEHAGSHWSLARALHAQRVSRIDPRLNEHSILSYCLKTYLGRHFQASKADGPSELEARSS